MEFILNDYHRNLSAEELLNDIKRVASMLNQNTLSREEYRQHGKYSYTTYQKRFGGWNKALLLCGLSLTAQQIGANKRKHSNSPILENELLSDIRRVAQQLGKTTISSSEYAQFCKYSRDSCFKKFGTWNNALELAGLEPYAQVSGKRIDDEDLLQEIERLWIQLGRQPTATDIRNGYSKYTLNTYSRHFGGWRGALRAFIDWINTEKTEIVLLESEETQNNRANTIQSPISPNISNNPCITRATTRDVNLRLRFKVMHRDNFKCCVCGASPAKDPSVVLHVDHIIPWAKGGETIIDNLQTLCSKCNLGKSDLDFG